MRALLDTCALSEILHPNGAARVKRWVEAIADDDLFLSAVTVGEIAQGIALAEPGRKRDRIQSYLLRMEQEFGERLVPVDAEVALIWGRLAAEHRRRGLGLSVPDGLIAASAIRHGLHLVTRNTKDFVATGAMLVDPWDGDS